MWWLIIACIVAIAIWSSNSSSRIGDTNVCNNVDGRCYDVVGRYENIEGASEMLAEINLFCITFMEHLRDKYIHGVYLENTGPAADAVSRLLANYNPDGIVENAPIDDVNTSYVDGKGRIFALCLREKLSGKNNFHSMNELKFVILHELAHMANASYGHDVSFWTVFKFLLIEAHNAGMYTPIDHGAYPFNYCSLQITYSPFFDTSLADYSKN